MPKGYPWDDSDSVPQLTAEEPAPSALAEEPAPEPVPPEPETPIEATEALPGEAGAEARVEPWVGRRRQRTRQTKSRTKSTRVSSKTPKKVRVEPVAEPRPFEELGHEVPVELAAEPAPRPRKTRSGSRSRSKQAPVAARVGELAGDLAAKEEVRHEIPIESIEAPLEVREELPVEPLGEPAAEIEPIRPPAQRARALLSIVGLAVAAFGVGLVVFNNMVMPRLIHSVGEVRVPDLTNLTVEQAERLLQPINLVLSRAGERFDPSVPRGFILSQEPTPETPVRSSKRVLVVVSLGEEFSTVPELFGESLRSARYLLERAGLKVGAITRAPSEEVGEGLVAGSDPPAEALLARDTPVSLLVSSGTGGESYVMPDVAGREINGVRRRFESLGFRVFTPPAAPSIGTIVFQDPPPGSRITRGATILLQATGRTGR